MGLWASVRQRDHLLLWKTQYHDTSHDDSYILHYSSKYRHAHRGGKAFSRTNTDSGYTLVPRWTGGFFFILDYHDSAPSTKSNTFVMLDFYPLEITFIVFISSYPKHFFFFFYLAATVNACLEIFEHPQKIEKWKLLFRLDAPKIKHTAGIFLGWQSCTLVLHFSMVLISESVVYQFSTVVDQCPGCKLTSMEIITGITVTVEREMVNFLNVLSEHTVITH